MTDRPSLAVIGGTGPEGRGLALRLAQVGYEITVGSRSLSRAEEAADALAAVDGGSFRGMSNEDAAGRCDIILVAIPYAGLADTLPPLRAAVEGKVVISAVAPVEFPEGRPVALRVPAGSAAQEVQERLRGARVVSAFQTVDAHRLQDLGRPLDTDVIVCSDDVEARRQVVAMANEIPGVRGLSGGRLAASRYVEECTALLITLNRIYKIHSGLKITGIDR